MKKNTRSVKQSAILKRREKDKTNKSIKVGKIDSEDNIKGFTKEKFMQLEDLPSTDYEKKVSIDRLPFEFFDNPCETLAQKLLGNVLGKQSKTNLHK